MATNLWGRLMQACGIAAALVVGVMTVLVGYDVLARNLRLPSAAGIAEASEYGLALATLVPPGPFGLRTVELGVYLGIFDGDQLVAMAGERTEAAALREVSGVCTHPDHQGRGYARALMQAVIRLQLARQQTPFLHVMESNVNARRMYERMGFRVNQSLAVRVVTRVR